MFFFNPCIFSISSFSLFASTYSFFPFLWSSQDILVGTGNTLEVSIHRKKDSWLKKNFEYVVFLLEFLVLFVGNSVSDKNIFSFVDPNVVDNIPDSDKSNWDNHQNNGKGKFCSWIDIILDEPVDKECRCQVQWDQKNDSYTWEPPSNLVIQD